MDNRKSRIVLFDEGGPILFIFGFHLLIGNFFIGLAEYYFVKKVYKIGLNGFGLFLIIVANYVSLIIGFMLSGLLGTPDGHNTFQTMVGPITITLILSIGIEWIFFFYAIKKVEPETSKKRTFTITATAQLFSYLLMLAYYFVTKVNY